MARSVSNLPDANKPKVGIIYSAGHLDSAESKSLAYYLAGSLVSRGFAKSYLVGLTAEGSPCDLQKEHNQLFKGCIAFLPPGKTTVREVRTAAVAISDGSATVKTDASSSTDAQIFFCHWNELTNCQVIIVAVNSNDTVACSSKLASILGDSQYRVVVFSLQRGVKNGGILKDGLRSVGVASNSKESSNVAVVEGIAAFACVPVPYVNSPASVSTSGSSDVTDHFYSCTIITPQIMLERLNKEIAEVAEGPVNLLETIGIEIQFRKTLTPHSWGILLYENLYALNIVCGGDLRTTLKCRRFRLILGLMVREFRETLLKAAGSGKWVPQMGLIAFHLTPWMFEMALVVPLPDFFFAMFWAILNIFAGCIVPWGHVALPGVRSPGLWDLASGRRTTADWHLAEIVSTGERHKVDTPMCVAVLSTIKFLELSVLQGNSPRKEGITFVNGHDYSADLNALKGRMHLIDSAYASITANKWYRHPGVWEISYRMLQMFAMLFLLVVAAREFSL